MNASWIIAFVILGGALASYALVGVCAALTLVNKVGAGAFGGPDSDLGSHHLPCGQPFRLV